MKQTGSTTAGTAGLPVFVSGAPRVKLVNAFQRPFENAVATARTCYSARGPVTEAEVSGDVVTDPGRREAMAQRRDSLARSIYKAGHHTTLQHAHFQFILENVSRHFVWSFLHAHPYYNSEQVSQRYVEVKPDAAVVPPLEGAALSLYQATVAQQMKDYHDLIDSLGPIAEAEYLRLFPARRNNPRTKKDVQKKAQEIARYVLPVATTAYMYHTVSGITLLRYRRLCHQMEASLETRWVVESMVAAMLEADPLFEAILEEPLPVEQTPEFRMFEESRPLRVPARFRAEFDGTLGGRVSLLVDSKSRNEEVVADAVREVLGLTRDAMTDDDAIRLALDPSRNIHLGQTLNVSTLSKLTRCLFHAGYTFRKKLSHTADSQDQRHRMTPASRPLMAAHVDDAPDYVTPDLVRSDPRSSALYETSMVRSWQAAAGLVRMGVDPDLASYLLPNALAIRFTESADLLNLHHKVKSRLCYNSQEEIWRASMDEVLQIRDRDPRIGLHLVPPCTLRARAGVSPICPEGDRYCGVPVWRIDVPQYHRLI